MPLTRSSAIALRLTSGCAILSLVAACGGSFDPDMRGYGNGFTTANAAANAGMVNPAGAVPVQPEFTAPTTTLAAAQTDVTAIAGAALDRAGNVTTQPMTSAQTAAPAAQTTPAAAPATQNLPFGTMSAEPIRHIVARGETAYTIARLYNVPVGDIAAWNSLSSDLAVREGQTLLVPIAGGTPPSAAAAPVTQPGQGSPTPVPPSASQPLPPPAAPATTVTPPATTPAATATTPAPAASPAPNLGAQQTTTSSSARLAMPAQGSIIRAYAAGRNEGIDIGAAAGSEVKAADAGTVAAVTTNTDGVQIVVIRHSDGLMTVYTHLDNLTVQKDSTVARGQTIGRVRAGNPSYLHFEVRRGMASQDPTQFLP